MEIDSEEYKNRLKKTAVGFSKLIKESGLYNHSIITLLEGMKLDYMLNTGIVKLDGKVKFTYGNEEIKEGNK